MRNDLEIHFTADAEWKAWLAVKLLKFGVPPKYIPFCERHQTRWDVKQQNMEAVRNGDRI